MDFGRGTELLATCRPSASNWKKLIGWVQNEMAGFSYMSAPVPESSCQTTRNCEPPSRNSCHHAWNVALTVTGKADMNGRARTLGQADATYVYPCTSSRSHQFTTLIGKAIYLFCFGTLSYEQEGALVSSIWSKNHGLQLSSAEMALPRWSQFLSGWATKSPSVCLPLKWSKPKKFKVHELRG